MEQVSFDIWWQDFLDDHNGDKDGGYDEIRHLRSYYQNELAPSKREDFLGELTDLLVYGKRGAGLAATLLEEVASNNQLDRLVTVVTQSKPSAQPSSIEFALRVLAVRAHRPGLPLVVSFLKQYPQNPLWDWIALGLCPANEKLFAQIWKEYLVTVPFHSWVTDTLRRKSHIARKIQRDLWLSHPLIAVRFMRAIAGMDRSAKN